MTTKTSAAYGILFRVSWVTVTAWAGVASLGQAHTEELFSDITTCAIITQAIDSKDGPKIRAFHTYVLAIMEELDFNHTKNGEPGILGKMTDKDRAVLSFSVVKTCNKHPKMKIIAAAEDSYGGWRDIVSASDDLGNK